MPFFVYILRSQSTGRFYVGQTQDVEQRVAYHNAGYSKSLKNRGPWELIHREGFSRAWRRNRRADGIGWRSPSALRAAFAARRGWFALATG
jgi:putative endonuclease